jgi:hypothetical protein
MPKAGFVCMGNCNADEQHQRQHAWQVQESLSAAVTESWKDYVIRGFHDSGS